MNHKIKKLSFLLFLSAFLSGCEIEFKSKERQCSDATIAVATTTDKFNKVFDSVGSHSSEKSDWYTANKAAVRWRDSVCPKLVQ